MGKVLHASFSGYFPTCIIEGIPTPSQDYLSLTLEQAMALFWRVKTWEARASGSFYSYSIGSDITYTSNSFSDMTPSITIQEEKNLVCKGSETFSFSRNATANIPSPISGTIDFGYTFTSIKKNASTYYPSFFVVSINALSLYSPFFAAKIGTYKITYLDYDITGDIFSADGSSGSALIEIRAKEYWTYGGTYNSQTG